ncbi:Band 4.1-like protein 3 [Clonorchis sinensis]|uniref:Band 4.1-like protein 3 n=1 Tax=Clonorchis sinensis TaxID=79923 RepID=A0A8T1M148_CLOSI|nr:Band 4.1-like protein 3 [Clonorchis sinensis]
MQYAMEPAPTSGYLSNGDNTPEFINLTQLEGRQWNQLDDGTVEVVDRAPKKEYYLSLRRPINPTMTLMGTGQRKGSFSGSSGLGPTNGGASASFAAPTGRSPSPGATLTRNSNPPVTNFKPSGKTMDCTVVMLDGTPREFRIDRAAYGQQLFEAVCAHLALSEVEYFGLTYYDSSNTWFWLNMRKKIAKQLPKNEWRCEFQVRFYPYDIDGIKEDLTRYYLCLQVRQDLVSGQKPNWLPCSFMVYCLLGAYIIQSEAGDHDPAQHVGIKYIQDHPFAPHVLQTPEMLERMVQLHKLHRGKTPQEADRLFLQNARCLALYGVDLHKVKNSQGKDVHLGVYHGGFLLYRNRIRLMHISWPHIIKFSYRDRTFMITLRRPDTDPSDTTLSFKCQGETFAKRLFDVCADHHAFFRLRGSARPKKPSFLPTFATRKYHFPSSLVFSPPSQPSMNGAQRPQSQFRPVHMHPQNPNWFTLARPGEPNHPNGVIASQYQYQPAMFDGDVGTMNPVYLDGQYVTNGHTGQQGIQRHLPHGAAAPGVGAGEYHHSGAAVVISRPVFVAEHWRISPADRTPGLGIDPHGLDVAAQRGAGWQGCRANKGVKAPGAYYFEAVCLEDGLVRVGWSTNEASLELGTDNCGFGFGADAVGASGANGTGRAMHRNTGHDYGVSVKQGDVIGCWLDLNKGSVAWSCNGEVFQRGFTIPDQLRGEAFLPAASLKDSRILFNFGDQALEYPPQGPFIPVAQVSDDSEVPNRITGWRMNPYDASAALDISPDGSKAQAHWAHGWQGCRSNQGIRGPGRFYFEATPLEDTGLCRIGWSTEDASLNLGTDRFGFGYGADNDGFGLNGQQGKRMHCDEIENYGEAFTKDDVIGCFLDTIEHTVKWSKNGIDFGEAYHIPPDLFQSATAAAFFPTVSLLNSTVEFNFGDKRFQFYPGPDWTPVCCTPANYLKRTRRKGPERKVKGWSYIDPSVLQQQMKIGHAAAAVGAARAVERHEEELPQKTNVQSPSPKSPLPPPGAVPLPGLVIGSTTAPISPVKKPSTVNTSTTQTQSSTQDSVSPIVTDSVVSPKPRSPVGAGPYSSTPSAQSPNIDPPRSYQGSIPVYDLRDCTRRVVNGEVVSVRHSQPVVETESFVDEHGKLIKRTVKRSEVTTTKTVSERVIASEWEPPAHTNGHVSKEDPDQALNKAIMEVTNLDQDISVMSNCLRKLELRSTQQDSEL